MNILKYFIGLAWYIFGFYNYGPSEFTRSPEMALFVFLIILMPILLVMADIDLIILCLVFPFVLYGFLWIGGLDSFFPCWVVGSVFLVFFSYSDD